MSNVVEFPDMSRMTPAERVEIASTAYRFGLGAAFEEEQNGASSATLTRHDGTKVLILRKTEGHWRAHDGHGLNAAEDRSPAMLIEQRVRQ